MPSSLTVNLSSALVYSTQPPVSVCGTVATAVQRLAGFLGSLITSLSLCAGTQCTFRFDSKDGLSCPCQYLHPSTGYSVSRQDCHSFVAASLHCYSKGIFTFSSIGCAVRLLLRLRLTLIRLTLIRNPGSFGEGVSHPLYRYLYLHWRFQGLQHVLQHTFRALGMLPYRYLQYPMASATGLCPSIIHAVKLD